MTFMREGWLEARTPEGRKRRGGRGGDRVGRERRRGRERGGEGGERGGGERKEGREEG